MTKLIPIFINGTNWIQLSQLQGDQARKLRSWIPKNCLKSVRYQGLLLKDCLDFDTYEHWFRTQQVAEPKLGLSDF
ncbi:MAG: hypothetical protein NXH89_08780 [Cyclobacteriaceae bacterium]|nr:hypothetical protein [Cyclobacteriaceae bacterium]